MKVRKPLFSSVLDGACRQSRIKHKGLRPLINPWIFDRLKGPCGPFVSYCFYARISGCLKSTSSAISMAVSRHSPGTYRSAFLNGAAAIYPARPLFLYKMRYAFLLEDAGYQFNIEKRGIFHQQLYSFFHRYPSFLVLLFISLYHIGFGTQSKKVAESHFFDSIVIYCPIFITNTAGISPPASVLTSVTSLCRDARESAS